jgi:hypothetical protein
VSLLRDSFRGINSRFHLAGIYAVASLVWRIAESEQATSPDAILLVVFVMVLFFATVCGVRGLVFHAASGEIGTVSFARYSAALFLPLLWLLLKIGLIQAGAILGTAWLYHLLSGQAGDYAAAFKTVVQWGAPLFVLGGQILALYSIPYTIFWRERGKWRPHLAAGLAILRAFSRETRLLLLPLLGIAALEGGLIALKWPLEQDPGPDVAETLIMFAQAYLELVALYGASRVVAAVAARQEGRPPGAPDPPVGGGEA